MNLFTVMLTTLGLAANIMSPSALAAGTTNLNEYLDELNSTFKIIEQNYAPLQWKSTAIGMDWNLTKSQLSTRTLGAKSTADFYYILADLFNGLDDAHTTISIPSTFARSLPIQFVSVQKKFVVNAFLQNEMTKQGCALSVGDELTAIDGMAPSAYQATNKAFHKNGNPITNDAMFAMQVNTQREASGITLSKNMSPTVKYDFIHNGAATQCELRYQVSGIPIVSREIRGANPMRLTSLQTSRFNLAGLSAPEQTKLNQLNSIVDKVNELWNMQMAVSPDDFPNTNPQKDGDPKVVGKPIQLGAEEFTFKMPSNFVEIKPDLTGAFAGLKFNWKAGYFDRNGKRIGVLRIPSYVPGPQQAWVPLVRFYIGKLQKMTDVLVIDQMNNPGGAVVFADLVVQSLVGNFDSSKHLRFQVKPTQAFLRSFLELISAIKQNEEVFSDNIKKRVVDTLKADFLTVKKAYDRGDALSEPISLLSTSEVLIEAFSESITANPFLAALFAQQIGEEVLSPQVYTKPVFMTINELDFSGGDATPATLQDYDRVKMVGVRTAGAGGTVNEYQNILGDSFGFRLTTSLMVRKSGGYVENLGVTPDVPFELNVNDYQTGFSNTFDRLLATIGL